MFWNDTGRLHLELDAGQFRCTGEFIFYFGTGIERLPPFSARDATTYGDRARFENLSGAPAAVGTFAGIFCSFR